jgi:hypothetical protein
MDAQRTARVMEILAPLSKTRETDRFLARNSTDMLAEMMRIPAHVAAALAKSPRLAVKAGALVRAKLGLSSGSPQGQLAPFLNNAESARQLSTAVGLAIILGSCRAALLKTEVEALRKIYGSDVVDFAFRHSGAYAQGESTSHFGAITLHNSEFIRKTGTAAVLGWSERQCGPDAKWLKVLFPGKTSEGSLAASDDATGALVGNWWTR